MEEYRKLDSITCPLQGTNIIEASAGTGKTYNIENLYARLILQKKFPVDSILVVTFTEAATKELKDRIRNILYEIQAFLEGKENVEERVKMIVHSCSNFIQSPESRTPNLEPRTPKKKSRLVSQTAFLFIRGSADDSTRSRQAHLSCRQLSDPP